MQTAPRRCIETPRKQAAVLIPRRRPAVRRQSRRSQREFEIGERVKFDLGQPPVSSGSGGLEFSARPKSARRLPMTGDSGTRPDLPGSKRGECGRALAADLHLAAFGPG